MAFDHSAPYGHTMTLRRAYQRIRRLPAVNLPQICPYSIRNKVVTVLRRNHVGGAQCSQWLGHADPAESRTTWCYYSEYDPSFLRDAADAIDEWPWELDRLTDRDLFASADLVPCKFLASPEVGHDLPVVFEPNLPVIPAGKMVGAAGIEPATPTMSME